MNLTLKVLNIDDPSIIQGLTEQKRRYDMGVNQPHAATSTGSASVPCCFAAASTGWMWPEPR